MAPLQQVTVLVVEDDLDSREITRMLLESLGARVVLATNGQEALEKLETENPTLALVDLRMPIMDGYEFAKRVRSDPARKHLRLVALTVLSEPEHYLRPWAIGFDGHLVKPVTYEMMETLARTLMAGGRTGRKKRRPKAN